MGCFHSGGVESDVASYLKRNPSFTEKWFLEHTDIALINEWIMEHPNVKSTCIRRGCGNMSNVASLVAPGDVTTTLDQAHPHRKMSMKIRRTSRKISLPHATLGKQEEEQGSPHLYRTISISEFYKIVREMEKSKRKGAPSPPPSFLPQMTTSFSNLVKDLYAVRGVDPLCHKILVNACIIASAERGNIYLVKGNPETPYLQPKFIGVTMHTTLSKAHRDATRLPADVRIYFDEGLIGKVAKSKQSANITSTHSAEPAFAHPVSYTKGYRVDCALYKPICNDDGEVVGVVELFNKANAEEKFSEKNELDLASYLLICGHELHGARLFETAVSELQRLSKLLNMSRLIFEETNQLKKLVIKIGIALTSVLECESCIIYLTETEQDNYRRDFHKNLVSLQRRRLAVISPVEPKIFASLWDVSFDQIYCVENGAESTFSTGQFQLNTLIKLAMEAVISVKGKNYNVTDIRLKIDEFYKEKIKMDSLTVPVPSVPDLQLSEVDLSSYQGEEAVLIHDEPFEAADSKTSVIDRRISDLTVEKKKSTMASKTRDYKPSDMEMQVNSLLCMPIIDFAGRVIGVLQLMNKLTNEYFTNEDFDTLKEFVAYFGLGIHNCRMFECIIQLMIRQQLSLEIISYHATADKGEVELLLNSDIDAAKNYGLYSFRFSDANWSYFKCAKATVAMFNAFNFLNIFHINYTVLCRWVLTVKKNYREVYYHNWNHGFLVTQAMFTLLRTANMKAHFKPIEQLGFIVACLCHDVDHRGTTNTFQVLTGSALATLYSTSTMEHHHFNQTLMILNFPGCNILENLTSEEYSFIISLIEYLILQTDLAQHFKIRNSFIALVKQGEKNWQGQAKEVLKSIMMTASDLASGTRPWETQFREAKRVFAEFFEQGDKEKEMFSKTAAMMDREYYHELPKMQVNFIDGISEILYRGLAKSHPLTIPMYAELKKNRKIWQALADSGRTKTFYDPQTQKLVYEPKSENLPRERSGEMLKLKND